MDRLFVNDANFNVAWITRIRRNLGITEHEHAVIGRDDIIDYFDTRQAGKMWRGSVLSKLRISGWLLGLASLSYFPGKLIGKFRVSLVCRDCDYSRSKRALLTRTTMKWGEWSARRSVESMVAILREFCGLSGNTELVVAVAVVAENFYVLRICPDFSKKKATKWARKCWLYSKIILAFWASHFSTFEKD